MQYSIAKLMMLMTLVAIGLAAIRYLFIIGLLSFFAGMLMILGAMVAYPIAVITSPQKDTYLDLGGNPVFHYLHRLLAFGLTLVVVSFFCIAASN